MKFSPFDYLWIVVGGVFYYIGSTIGGNQPDAVLLERAVFWTLGGLTVRFWMSWNYK